MEEEIKNPAPDTATNAETPTPETAEKPEPRAETKKKEKAAIKLAAQLEKELDETKKQLDNAGKDLNEAKDSLMRTTAEYENYRKRTTREKESSFSNGVSNAVTELLPVIDTLEMAANAPTQDEAYRKGVELTLDKCRAAFEKLGIAEIEAVGSAFDPELHNAVMQESVEGTESGTVTKVLQKGYTLAGKVIRHAAVAVCE